MHAAYIGLGANLGEPLLQLRAAVAALRTLPQTTLDAVSPLYGSAPIGPQDQPDYLNAVARLSTTLPPHVLLRQLQAIEQDNGRVRQRHWGERTLDLDLLLYAEDVIRTPELAVPHPELPNRAFVVRPLLDLDSQLFMPNGDKISDLLPQVSGQDLHELLSHEWWKAVD